MIKLQNYLSGNQRRNLKGWIVFRGDNVLDENIHEAAIFAEMSSVPATIQAGKVADAYGIMPGMAYSNVMLNRHTFNPSWVVHQLGSGCLQNIGRRNGLI